MTCAWASLRASDLGSWGPHGAGKTTTLSILSGDQQATSGDALVAGQSLVHSSGASPRGALLGYCPQQVDPSCLKRCHAESFMPSAGPTFLLPI